MEKQGQEIAKKNQEIQHLLQQVSELKKVSSLDKPSDGYDDKIIQMNRKFERDTRILTEKLLQSEQNSRQLLEIVQDKKNNASSSLEFEKETITRVKRNRSICSLPNQLEKIDNIITTLSQQNDPQKLHSVAKELLSL